MKLNHEILGHLVLTRLADGVYIDQDERYHPFPAPDGLFVNPKGPTFGQVKTGDVMEVIVPFGLKNASLPYARNVFHYVFKGITGSPTFAAVATELVKQLFVAWSQSNGGQSLSRMYTNTYQFKNPTCRSLNESTDSVVVANSLDGENDGGTQAVPLRSSIVAHKSTAKRGRSFQGRTFFPAPDEDTQRAGNIGSTNAALVQSGLDASDELSLAAINNGAAATLGVYSPTLSNTGNAIIVTPLTSYTARPVLGSQRRRQDVT